MPRVKKLRDGSGITWVHAAMPPHLFIHGSADTGVPLDQSTRMCDSMKAAGARCEVIAVEGAPHGIENWESKPEWTRYKSQMIAWLKQNLTQQNPARQNPARPR